MDHQIERMVEGGKAQHHADRLHLGKGHATRRGGVQVHRDDMATFRPQGLNAKLDPINTPVNLDQCIAQRLAGFACNLQGQRLAPPTGDGGSTPQDRYAFDLRQPVFAAAKERMGGCKGGFHLGLG